MKYTELYNKANISTRSRKKPSEREREKERRQTNLNEHSRLIAKVAYGINAICVP